MHMVNLTTPTLSHAQMSAGPSPFDRLTDPIPTATENDFCDRLAEAVVGDVIVYHLGLLARDRSPVCSDLPEGQRVEVAAIANRAMRLCEAGRVLLVQRRLDAGCCAYLAIVRLQPRRMASPRSVTKAPQALVAGEVAR